MAGSLNKIMLIGNTGDDVKMHYFEGGGCVGNFPVATNESYVNKTTGERIDSAEWHNIVVRNKGAEACEKYLKKGDKVYIEGRIKTRKWQDESGNDRYITEVRCDQFIFLTPKENSGYQADGAGPQQAQPQTQQQPSSNTAETPQQQPQPTYKDDSGQEDMQEDDLPF